MSLDGFNFFVNGWDTIIVEQILSTQPRIFFVVVDCSYEALQKYLLPSLQVWAAIKHVAASAFCC